MEVVSKPRNIADQCFEVWGQQERAGSFQAAMDFGRSGTDGSLTLKPDPMCATEKKRELDGQSFLDLWAEAAEAVYEFRYVQVEFGRSARLQSA